MAAAANHETPGQASASAAMPVALVTQATQAVQLPSSVAAGTSLIRDLEHIKGGSTRVRAHPATDVYVERHSPGQPAELIDVQASLLHRPTRGIVAAAQLRPQSVHQPSRIASAALSGFIHAKAPASHRARMDLETNLAGSHRATLEGSWQLSRQAVGSLTLGTDVCKGGIARGLALETRLSKGSKLLLRCLAEPSFGWQWLATLSQRLSRSQRLEVHGIWHRPGAGCVAGSPSFLADQCNLSLHLVGTGAPAAGVQSNMESSASSRYGTHHAGRRPSEPSLQSNEEGGRQPGVLEEPPHWSIVVSCDPRALTSWVLQLQLH